MNQTKYRRRDELDLRELFLVLKKRYKLILVGTFIALAAGIAFNSFLIQPVYQTKAVVSATQATRAMPSSVPAKVVGLEDLMDSLASVPQLTINTYVNQLQSDAVMSRVIEKLKLDQQGYSPSTLAGLVSVKPVEDTSLIDVRVVHSNPYTAQRIANTVTQEFLNFMNESVDQQMGKSIELLRNQSETAAKELKMAEANLQKLQVDESNVVVLEQAISSTVKNLAEAQSGLLQAKTAHQGILAGIAQARSQLRAIPPTIKVLSKTSASETTLNVIQAEPAKDSIAGTPGPASHEIEETNPAYRDFQAKINQKMIDAAQKGAEAASLGQRVAQLETELKNLQVEMAGKKDAVELARKEVNRWAQTDSLIKAKINEVQVAKSLRLGESNLSIVSPASVPTYPIRAPKQQNVIVAAVIGLMASIALAFLLHYMDGTLRTPQEVEDCLGLAVLAQVPVYKPYKAKRLRTFTSGRSGKLNSAFENINQ